MNNIGEKYLPLGTVVILKNATKRLMITGFCAKDVSSNSNDYYDYSGCMFPEGFISSNQTALFNHEQIDKIFHMGLVDEEENTFKEKLKQLVSASDLVSPQAPDSVLNRTESVESIPPIGPGLPGYVAPQPEVDDITNIPPIGPGLPGYVEPKAANDDITNIPPIGPGLPGYVEPKAANDDITSIPPIGPGLPGYVEPKVEENLVQSEQKIIDEIKFDENGVVIADFQFDSDN